ncbi:uncharacterized protein LOC142574297 [Dermacentor variabilis]|uniref:uncharacterized protein LOC142574297 n=1 Tax=Dermacentor variabilis TaxID=34621 RepID=UPI003F5BA5ED
MTLTEYADTRVKETIWQRIASEMGLEWPAHGPYDTKALRRFFDNKRRTYRLEKMKVETTKSGMACSDVYRGRWRFYNILKFLDTAKVPCRRSVSGETHQAMPES